ncbi:HBR100Wp [Eremothecium sinecaudum]|uniref:HBR100Wp n=1 Tax=Eremothecium sinecaudum TaxID=45286 RepID=A0A109UWS8_9SACH|nr:HBR100Wp [Eremothecium sinecaudum]AMD19001.1 HBR100Wp [Eremothecium sinecaudum]
MSEIGIALSCLLQESRLINLLYHRNKNQHKGSHWWASLHMLKCTTTQVINVLQKPVKYRRDLLLLYSLLRRFLKTRLKRIYYEYNTLISQGQFITLGVVLLGVLARVNSVFKEIMQLHSVEFERFAYKSNPKKEEVHDVGRNVDEEIGTLIDDRKEARLLTADAERIRGIDATEATKDTIVSGTMVTSLNVRKKKKKQKAKRSAIDDIFG